MNSSLDRASWIAYGNTVVKEMEEFIQSWNHKGCSQFLMGQTKFDWSSRRTRSRGGLYKVNGIWQPGISIAMQHYTRSSDNIYRWYEYKSFDDDSVIGGFYSDNLIHRFRGVVAHEMAHAIQYWHQWYNKTPRVKPHGDEFKIYYRLLREEFVNKILPDQKEMGAEYRNLRKIVVTQELGPIRMAA